MITKDTKKEIDVHVQSSTNALFQYYLMSELKTDITLTAPILADDEVINVSSGHGFTGVAGEYLVVRSGDSFEQTAVVSVDGNAITVEMPVANGFPVESSVIRGNYNMNVDGSGVPVEFKYSSNCCGDVNAITPIDLETVVISMQHGTNVPDDGKFGGIDALENGFYFRKINGERVNFGNYKDNQKFKDFGAAVEYTTKAPSGTNATNIIFDLVEIFGQAVRIDPRNADYVLGLVRDKIDVAEGMSRFVISLVGSFTTGE